MKVLNEIIKETSQYVEPTLHYIIKYPNRSWYLFNYTSDCKEPKINKIPKGVYYGYSKTSLKQFISNHTQTLDNNNNFKCSAIVPEVDILSKQEINTVYEQEMDHNENLIKENDSDSVNEIKEELYISDKCMSSKNNRYKSSAERLSNIQEQLEQHIKYLKVPSYCNFLKDENKDFTKDLYSFDTSILQHTLKEPTCDSEEQSKFCDNQSVHDQYNHSISDQYNSPKSSLCCPNNITNSYHCKLRRSSRLNTSNIYSSQKISNNLSKTKGKCFPL